LQRFIYNNQERSNIWFCTTIPGPGTKLTNNIIGRADTKGSHQSQPNDKSASTDTKGGQQLPTSY